MAALVQAGIIFREADPDKSAVHASHALRQPHEPSTSDSPQEQPRHHQARRSSLTTRLRTTHKLAPQQEPPASIAPNTTAPSRPTLHPRPPTRLAPSHPEAAPTPPPHTKPRRSRRPAIPRVDSLPFEMDDDDLYPRSATPHEDTPLSPADLLAVDTIRRTAQPTTPPEHRLAIDVADAYLQNPPASPADPASSMLHVIARHLDLRGYTVHIKTGLGGGIGRQCFQHQPHTFIQCGTLRAADASSHHASPTGSATSAPSSLTHAAADWTLIGGAVATAAAAPTPCAPIPTGGRLMVDPQLREQFTIASPTRRYAAVLAAVPAVFVGTEERLAELVRLMSEEAALSFKAMGRHMPPWREAGNIISKWMPARFTYAPMPPALPSSPPSAAGSPWGGSGRLLAGGARMPAAAAAADGAAGSAADRAWTPQQRPAWSPQQGPAGLPQDGGAGQQQWGADEPAVSIRYFKLPGGASC